GERLFAEGRAVLADNTAAARARAIGVYAQAADLFRSLDLGYEEMLSRLRVGLLHMNSGRPRAALEPDVLPRAFELATAQHVVLLQSPMLNVIGGAYDILGDKVK